MGRVIVTLRVMPSGVEVDLKELEDKVKEKVKEFGGEVGKVEIELIAFGLKALNIFFVCDESKSNMDPLEEKVKEIEGVNSAEVVDVRRTF